MNSRLFSIPAGLPFADELARGLLARTQGNPLALADMLVLLPTRRACRTLREAFLRESKGQPLLLPRMMPLGDLDADELMLTAGVTLPPAISPRRRQLLLARLIARQQPELPIAQLLQLARALGQLMDDFTLEGINTSKLDKLVEGELSEHWQTTLTFLQPILEGWPHLLKTEGALDPADRRSRLLLAQAEAWQKSPPAYPVIAAGSTGSIPSTAALLRVVASLPRGEIVLPGLPSAQECADYWDAVDFTHPLYELKHLLKTLNAPLDNVQPWPVSGDTQAQRRALLQHALLPAEKTALWATQKKFEVSNLTRIDCANEQEEAAVIALAMRAALEVPGQRAMLVTPDRNLGRRVASTLQRWNIGVDDSAGTPLHKTESATFLRALLNFSAAPGLVNLLALMKHPMAAAGVAMSECRQRMRTLELDLLRKHDPKQNLPVRTLADLASREHVHKVWLNDILAQLQPLIDLRRLKNIPLLDALTAHLKVAEHLAKTDVMDGVQRFWRAESGQALSDWVAELMEAGSDFLPVPVADLDDTLIGLMSDVVVRARYGEHPRLFILGPLEARLQQAEVIILGGLNEGSWPAPPEPDPWLSRPMRTRIGLKTPEERLGQEAHDFYTLASAPHVLMTRALRQEGTPTVPSRWLSRLDAVLGGHYGPSATDWLSIARQMDQPIEVRPATAPAPKPPVGARPTKLSVTQIETWIKDPYAIYAKKILDLFPLEELEPAPGAAERGNFFHAVLYRFLRKHLETLPPDALDELRTLGADELKKQHLLDQRPLWWPRFERVIEWFIESEKQRRHGWAMPLALEVDGRWTMDSGFTLHAKADRIDKLKSGGLAIMDYKTGTLPSAGERDRGFSVQLPLEGAIAQFGEFEGITKGQKVEELTFWRLTGGDPAGESEPFRDKKPVGQLIDEAVTRLEELVLQFRDEDTPYLSEPHGDMPPRYSDYRHLARVKEWASHSEEEE